MIRNVAGSVLALAGATAAVWSPFRAWYDGRHGRDYALDELFTGITDARADALASVLLPFVLAALLTAVGVVLRSRLLVALAGLVVLGFTVLWMVRVGQAEDGLTIGGDGAGLGDGVSMAFGGGVLMLVGAFVMSGRSHAHRVDRPPRHAPPPQGGPPPAGPPGPDRTGPDRPPAEPGPPTAPGSDQTLTDVPRPPREPDG
ncbi:hypothetical protein ACFW2Y_21535 [Streptomyces sp. NPDC058877]|uniref:hypothetical protein n=1 Tax=unclassified Streptomyces TaxID=2593676 RepID=UPI0036CF6E5B